MGHRMGRGLLCFLTATALLAACDSRGAPSASPPTPGSPTAVRSTTGPLMQPPSCHPASRIHETRAFGPEVRGTGHGATLYGLIMARTPPPFRAGESVKIVWRMTGRGPLRLTAISPQGRSVPLTFGPEQHGGSNYDRPGDEWGSGYRFTRAGCWRLHAQRTVGSADVLLEVLPADRD